MQTLATEQNRVIRNGLLAYALTQLGLLSSAWAAPLPGISDDEAACRSLMVVQFVSTELDPALKAAAAHHGGADTDGFADNLSAVRARMMEAATDFEAEEITPAKVRAALSRSPAAATHLDAYDAAVIQLQQGGQLNGAQIAERAWLHVRDVMDGGRIPNEPSRITAFNTQMMAFSVDHPLNEQEMASLSPDERTNSSYGLLAFLSLHGVPSVRLPFYGLYRHEHLAGCISAGPRGRAVIAALNKADSRQPIIGSPLLGDNKTDGRDQLGDNQLALTSEHPQREDGSMSMADHFATTFQQAAQAARVKQTANMEVGAARAEFFSLYPDKPGVEAARAKLANLLTGVDLYYFTLYLQSGMSDAEVRRVSAIDLATGGSYGHGIQPSAVSAFRRWVDVAREAMGAPPRDPAAGAINRLTGAPIPSDNRSVVECTKPVLVCSQDAFAPTAQGYLEGVAAAKDFYAYYVAIRDRAELSVAFHIPLFDLPPVVQSAPTPPIPPVRPLTGHGVSPFDPAVLGTNNVQAAHSMGSLLPNGADKWSTYQQVVSGIVQSGTYKTLDCTYGDPGATYHFWSGTVPPAFPQLVLAVTVGSVYGDAARLGTRPVAECPPDEAAAKTLQNAMLSTPVRPNVNAMAPEEKILSFNHERVGAAAASLATFKDWENSVKPQNVQRFNAEVEIAMAAKQQVLECDFATFGFTTSFFYWYQTVPANVKTLISLPTGYNGALSHMGITSRAACPATLAEARTLANQLTRESTPFVKY